MITEVQKHKNLVRYVMDMQKEWFTDREPISLLYTIT